MLDSTFAKTALDLPAFEDACSTAVSNSRAHFSMKNAEHTTASKTTENTAAPALSCQPYAHNLHHKSDMQSPVMQVGSAVCQTDRLASA